jgi:hypothetical protein
MKEHEIQWSICEGVARVLRSEVVGAQGLLRSGQRRGVRFEVVVKDTEEHVGPGGGGGHAVVDGAAGEKGGAAAVNVNGDVVGKPQPVSGAAKKWSPGHCAECLAPFVEWEVATLVGFACGHVFHLEHLLEKLHPGEEVDEVLLHGVAEQRSSHLIGAKVTHARLLRERIAGGCPVCVSKEEAG